MAFGDRLRLARLREGLSLEKLAARLDNKVSAQAINKYETGKMMPSSSVLVSLAKEAMGRREPVDAYGGRPECEALIALIARARVILESKVNVAQDVKSRSDDLRQRARYRNSVDTSPTAESMSLADTDVLAGKPLGATAASRMPNVLGEDTWDLFRVLLR